MSLFADQLKTLIATLEAVEEKKSFDMTNWHYLEARDVVDCGYVACICGHQAASDKSEFFQVSEIYVKDIARDISKQLNKSCKEQFGNDLLAYSIYDGSEYNRRDAAFGSKLFTYSQLNHPHLNKENPTIKQAISFIKLALKKVKAVK
jgi:hypothetical protein